MNVKVIGAGSIGNHLANACVTQGLHVTIVDIDKEALNRTKNIIYPERYGKWDENIILAQPDMLDGMEFDIIIIGTPPASHLSLAIEEIKNKTSEYIDTSVITDSIRAKLSQSGLIQFGVNIDELEGQISEIDRQQDEYYDENLSVEKGKLAGADYRLSGSLISIDKFKKKLLKTKKDKFYKLSLQLWNIKTGVLVWADEKDIRKTEG